MAALPLVHARESGATPSSFVALTSAPRANQQIRGRQIVPVHGPVQRRRAIRLRHGDRCLLTDERPHGRRILSLGRVDKTQVGLPGGRTGAGHEREQARQTAERPRPRPNEHEPQAYIKRPCQDDTMSQFGHDHRKGGVHRIDAVQHPAAGG